METVRIRDRKKSDPGSGINTDRIARMFSPTLRREARIAKQEKNLLGDCLADSFMALSHSGKQLVHAGQIPHPAQ
jgi:hypothetical protein